ncbi:exonuclease SbcCD subunit D [Paeniroseomonas aquatica]|uniref:Nuclease SbcCD subunit D n=2 Tax=Paeniroseomonas aquatica TaxID=373043 RepID=A0ABT8AAS9_9PROT|nr:exonuclease SbcCD subunit D [Paeniroseomonas aquatica]MDN3566711.1 exonuclease SbcCD subunit D [Paeniroseomonas aquatica]
MRFLHTADWHLGRTLGGHSLREDQDHLLGGQFLDMVRDTAPDAVLIAGDVFDRAVPAAEAVELLDDILHRIIIGLRVPVVMIPGNHDEARRLSFGARLLAAGGLHIADSPLGRATTFGDVTVVGCGYASPLMLAQKLGNGAEVADHDAGFGLLAPLLHGLCPAGGRRLLVAHAFVAGGSECESERSLSVGGTGQVGAARFAGFDYVALGHLHRPQTLMGGRLRYSGSPLAYSSSEAGQAKSVTLLELEADGTCRIEELPLSPRRQLRLVSGSFAELREAPAAGRDDFVVLTLTDPRPVPEAQRRLAEVFPHIIGFGYAGQERSAGPLSGPGVRARAIRPIELFAEFHAAMRDTPLPPEARPVLAEAIAAAEAAEA